ncbi:MAG: enoyl-CoA hydratase/isomerase family protein [Casimicrobiaceae bacterium]
MDEVLFRREATACGRAIGVLTLNRPRAINALTLAMCEAMLATLRAWQSDESIVCVVIEGAGGKGFCAGGDVAQVIRHVRAGGADRYVYGDQFFEVEYALDLLIHRYAKPIITLVHGICMGGGLGLINGAQERIVVEDARLAMPEIHIGFFPDVGGGWFLNRLPRGLGHYLALTGATLDAREALAFGLADHVTTADRAAMLLPALAASVWPHEPDALRAHAAALVARHAGAHEDIGVPVGLLALGRLAALGQAVSTSANVTAFRDRLLELAREDAFFDRPAQNLARGSPTAAHVIWRYLARTRSLGVAHVLALDLVLARRFQRGHDFAEGVRAVLIDKDRAPRWAPAEWASVEPVEVERHFAALTD